eukprot:4009786-Karenia_brevis.AAC.2
MGLEKDDEFIKTIRDPKLSTEEEVEAHFLRGHVEHRNRCGLCVRARGREGERDSARDNGKERHLPEYVWDYCFPGEEMVYLWTVFVR